MTTTAPRPPIITPGENAPVANPPANRMGLTVAMALVMGSIIGVGIFNLPSSLAFDGPITLVSMGLTTVGAVALALLFAALSRRLPADGGPYAYSRVAFGNPLGFANAWSYWITAWAGNAAIAVGWVLYVEVFINTGHDMLWSVVLVLFGLWVPAAINLSGLKNMGSVQVITTILKFIALAFMSTVGLFYISRGELHPVERERRERDRARSVTGCRSRCSATSVSRSRPLPRPRCGIPTGTSRGRRSSARSQPPSCTYCRSSQSSASCLRRPSRARPRRSPTRSTRCSGARSGATSWPSP